ncbi:MAG: divergent polysaccharide deacetylase family protein [Pseudolabrys sp.]
MPPDELNAPLGQDKDKHATAKPRRFGAPQLLAGLLALSGLMVAGWAMLVNDPLGGEPVAVVSTKAKPGERPAAAAANGEHRDGTAPAAASADVKIPPVAAGSNTVTIIDGSSGKRQEVVVPGKPDAKPKPDQHSSLAPIDRKLLETTRHGAIPVVAKDGARAATAYAQPRDLPATKKDLPRIAVVVGGVGISAAGTADAATMLPPPVTFALSPYGADLGKLAERARGEGHELLLQLPMEPFDYPDNDPGPQTLLTSLPMEQNIDRLHWVMSRFQGYVGVVSAMGARFTASEQALKPVIADAAKRGLIYVDDGASTRSIAGQIAGAQNMPFAKADVVIDAVPTPTEIDHALNRLEMAARQNGSAVGLASAQPATIERISAWAKKVEDRGFVLVPISMVALKAKSS